MRIVKKDGYYYLKHSFRKDGKVVTKEKYLGKKIPKNIEEIKQVLKRESKVSVSPLEIVAKMMQTGAGRIFCSSA